MYTVLTKELVAGFRLKSRFQLGIPFSLDALCPGEWCGRFDCQGSPGLTSPVVKVVNDHQYMVYLLCRAVSVRRYHDICTFRVACQCDDHPATMCADHETDTSAQVLPLNVRTSNQKCNLANVHCVQQCLLSDRIWDVGVTRVNNPFALSSTGLSDQDLAWCSDTVNATKIHLKPWKFSAGFVAVYHKIALYNQFTPTTEFSILSRWVKIAFYGNILFLDGIIKYSAMNF